MIKPSAQILTAPQMMIQSCDTIDGSSQISSISSAHNTSPTRSVLPSLSPASLWKTGQMIANTLLTTSLPVLAGCGSQSFTADPIEIFAAGAITTISVVPFLIVSASLYANSTRTRFEGSHKQEVESFKNKWRELDKEFKSMGTLKYLYEVDENGHVGSQTLSEIYQKTSDAKARYDLAQFSQASIASDFKSANEKLNILEQALLQSKQNLSQTTWIERAQILRATGELDKIYDAISDYETFRQMRSTRVGQSGFGTEGFALGSALDLAMAETDRENLDSLFAKAKELSLKVAEIQSKLK